MNYYKRYYFLFLFSIALHTYLPAQELSIGDKLPDYTFQSILRYSSPAVKLSDFRGKILILDLWRTTCGHAVASFTHFDSLQSEFGDQLAAFAVTTENRQLIQQYLDENGFAKKTSMPIITDDSLLAGKSFTFIYIPHVVVVDGSGNIVAITNAEEITSPVIRDLIAGKPINLPVKKEITDYDYDTPLFAEGKGTDLSSLVYTSTITRQLPGVLPLQSLDAAGNNLFYKAYNVSIPELYTQAYHMLYNKNKLILEVKDSSRFISNNYDDAGWQKENLWCYNLILPKNHVHPEQVAIEAFNRFFGITGSAEIRKVKCLLLVRKGMGDRWKSTDSGKEGYYLDSGGVKLIHNVILSFVSDAWNYLSAVPIINETGIEKEMVDMKIEGTPNDLAHFRKQLQRYDLDLVPAVREMKVLVIKEQEKVDR